jgi:hypothetical protein
MEANSRLGSCQHEHTGVSQVEKWLCTGQRVVFCRITIGCKINTAPCMEANGGVLISLNQFGMVEHGFLKEKLQSKQQHGPIKHHSPYWQRKCTPLWTVTRIYAILT